MPTNYPEQWVRRYDSFESVLTRRDPLEDLCSWVSGLRSRDVASSMLSQHHGISGKKLAQSAAATSVHAESATQFLDQAFSGPPDVAFLPIYYGLLNLAKICVIMRGDHDRIASNRSHGASYSGQGTASHDLMTDTITLRSNGALALFYEALTGSRVPRDKIVIRMRDLYRYVQDTQYEYERIYGPAQSLVGIRVTIEMTTEGKERFRGSCTGNPGAPPRKRQLRVLREFQVDPRTVGGTEFISDEHDGNARAALDSTVHRFLLWNDPASSRNEDVTPLTSGRLLLPEEFPILLVFYHLSCVARYKPEFMSKLRDSRAWSLLLILREHATYSFLNLFWSTVIQSQLIISR